MLFSKSICVLVFALLPSDVFGASRCRARKSRNLSTILFPSVDGGVVKAYLNGSRASRSGTQDVKFFLFTLKNKNRGQEIKIGDQRGLEGSNFVRGAPVKIVCHGFTGSFKDNPAIIIKDAYFKAQKNYNIIAVDWQTLARAPWYDQAADATKSVGEVTAKLMKWMHHKAPAERIHFIGHSLGAHVAGVFGYAMGSPKVARITALDPALPLFESKSDQDRIDPSDAEFVDVIHTAAGKLWEGGLAFEEPRGHADFYPNGGSSQPGCGIDPVGSCAHGRSYHYYAESIGRPHAFSAVQCGSWSDFKRGKCKSATQAFMGDALSSSFTGVCKCVCSARNTWSACSVGGTFYLQTNSKSPFGMG